MNRDNLILLNFKDKIQRTTTLSELHLVGEELHNYVIGTNKEYKIIYPVSGETLEQYKNLIIRRLFTTQIYVPRKVPTTLSEKEIKIELKNKGYNDFSIKHITNEIVKTYKHNDVGISQLYGEKQGKILSIIDTNVQIETLEGVINKDISVIDGLESSVINGLESSKPKIGQIVTWR